MLSKEDNETLTRVGPGTPMGEVLRQYWQPILLSTELPEPDGSPLRVRLLGEDLVAYRDRSGQVGLLGDHCPHRGASLFFGRNEEGGLRCVYHGWKFDTTGACVDMPNEPTESNFKDKIHHTAYACQERNGMVWAYLGPRTTPPKLPEIEWNLLPESQTYVSKRYQECNWAQTLEGGIDSSHGSFLHVVLDPDEYKGHLRRGWHYNLSDRHPHFEVVDTTYGALISARRNAEDDQYYWRITQFLMPFYTMIPPYGPRPSFSGHAFVPIDDHNTMVWSATWHPTLPLNEELRFGSLSSRKGVGGGIHVHGDDLLPATSAPGGAFRPRANRSNDYLINWEMQRTTRFSGIPGIALQDAAVQESMGPIYDRSQEHLGTSDTGIIQVRRRWLDAVEGLRTHGIAPRGLDVPEAYRVRPAAIVLPRDAAWVEEAQPWLVGTEGAVMDAV